MIVAFSGTDGTGKTTLAKEIKAELEEQGVSCEYHHEYDYIFLKYVLRLLGDQKVEKERRKFLDEDKNDAEVPITHKLWPYFVFMDALILLLYYRIKGRNKVVILDRYVYDQFISFKRLGVGNELMERLCLAFPKPDISVFLKANPEVAYNRKKETHDYPVSFYEQTISSYEDLTERMDVDFIRTDTQGKEETKAVILGKMMSNRKFRRIFLRDTTNNRTLYRFLKDNPEVGGLDSLREHYADREEKISETLELVDDLLESGRWVLIKTYMPFPHLPTYDLDLLIDPEYMDEASRLLKKEGFKETDEDEPWKRNFKKPGFFKVSLHGEVAWEGIEYLNREKILANKRNVDFLGVSVPVPSKRHAVLIQISHALFEITTLRKGDFDFVMELLANVEEDYLIKEAKEENWGRGFRKTLNLIQEVSQDKESVRFPYSLPLTLIFQSLIERAVSEDLTIGGRLRLIKISLSEISRFFVWRTGYRILNIAAFRDIIPEEMSS